jgi:putative transposase
VGSRKESCPPITWTESRGTPALGESSSSRECLDRLLIVNQRHLRFVLEHYVEHYNSHRPHRSLAQRSPDRRHDPERPATTVDSLHLVHRQEVLGGLINDYKRAA